MKKNTTKKKKSVNDILQLSLHSGAFILALSSQSYNCFHVISFVLPWPWDAKVNYSLAVQVQLDDNYTTAGSRGGKQFLSMWACTELIRWFSSFLFFLSVSSLGKGGGRQGRIERTQEGLACSTRLRGKRLWVPLGWKHRGEEGFSHGALGPADPLREVRKVTLLSR